MKRPLFLLIAALLLMAVGTQMFLFTETTVASSFSEITGPILVLAKAIGIFVFSIGLMNMLARKSGDTPALKSIMIGTICYLLGTAGSDAYFTMAGILSSQTWGSVAMRFFLSLGYLYYLLAPET